MALRYIMLHCSELVDPTKISLKPKLYSFKKKNNKVTLVFSLEPGKASNLQQTFYTGFIVHSAVRVLRNLPQICDGT